MKVLFLLKSLRRRRERKMEDEYADIGEEGFQFQLKMAL